MMAGTRQRSPAIARSTRGGASRRSSLKWRPATSGRRRRLLGHRREPEDADPRARARARTIATSPRSEGGLDAMGERLAADVHPERLFIVQGPDRSRPPAWTRSSAMWRSTTSATSSTRSSSTDRPTAVSCKAWGRCWVSRYVYGEDGRLIDASFMDCVMPRATDIPRLKTSHHSVPCTTNPLGVKGAGDSGVAGRCRRR